MRPPPPARRDAPSDSPHYLNLKPKPAFLCPRCEERGRACGYSSSCHGQAFACEYGGGTKACDGSSRRRKGERMSGTATAGKPPKNWEGETLRTWPRTRQAVFGTMIMAEINRFRGDTLAPGESKFENPEIGSFRETAVRAHFGRKLQKIFPLPSDEFGAGRRPHASAKDPRGVRHAAHSWKRVRAWESRNAPARIVERGRFKPAAGLSPLRVCRRCKRR